MYVNGTCRCITEQIPKEQENDSDTILSEDINFVDDSADGSSTTSSGKIKLDQYTITLLVIAVLQLIFCFGICFWTNIKVANAKKQTARQQAEFYTFLYQFHR